VRRLRNRDIDKGDKLIKTFKKIIVTLKHYKTCVPDPNSEHFKNVLLHLRAQMTAIKGYKRKLPKNVIDAISEIRGLLAAIQKLFNEQPCAESEMLEAVSQDILVLQDSQQSSRGRNSKKKTESTQNYLQRMELDVPFSFRDETPSASTKSSSCVVKKSEKNIKPPVASEKAQSQTLSYKPTADELIRQAHADALELWSHIDEMEAQKDY
jgi:hypothetical protein